MASTTFVDGNPLTAAQMNTLGDTVDGYATTATSAGTTVLTVASKYQQFFTGSTTHTVTMPVASTLVVGWKIRVVNNSSGIVTVQSSGANTIYAVPAGADVLFTCILASGTTAASWDYKNHIATPATATFVGVAALANAVSHAFVANTELILNFTTEAYDSDAFHDNVTNNSRLTIPTGKGGKYRVSINFDGGALTGNYGYIYLKKNGTNVTNAAEGMAGFLGVIRDNTGNSVGVIGSVDIALAAGDYIEVSFQGSATATVNIVARFSATYLGA